MCHHITINIILSRQTRYIVILNMSIN